MFLQRVVILGYAPELFISTYLLISNRQLKLNYRALTSDDLIESPNHPSCAISGMVFGSDLARSWTQNSADVESVQPDFLIRHLPSLLKLEKIQIQNAPWLTGDAVQDILRNCPRLRIVDFRHSGKMTRDQSLVVWEKTAKWEIAWAMKGSRKECAATFPVRTASGSLIIVSKQSIENKDASNLLPDSALWQTEGGRLFP